MLIYDETRLREPKLFTPGEQPVGAVRVDHENKILPAFLYVPEPNRASRARNLVDGADLGEWDSEVITRSSQYGFGLQTPNNHSFGDGLSVPFSSTSNSHTTEFLFYVGDWLWESATIYFIDSETGRFLIGTNDITYKVYNGGWRDTGLTIGEYTFAHIIIVNNAVDNTLKFYLRREAANWALEEVGLTYAATPYGGVTRLLSRYTTTADVNPRNLVLYLAAIYDRALTPLEVFSRFSDRYQFLIAA